MYELKKAIDVYTYKTGDRAPVIEKIQTISTTSTKKPDNLTAACAMRMSVDQKYIYCTNAGENTISVYKRDEETGLLTMICCLPISGAYPKDVAVFPDGRHIASVNHDSGTISFFKVDYEKGLLVMSGRSIPVNEPNCCAIVKIGD
jgi:6-phosphogluconolactonase